MTKQPVCYHCPYAVQCSRHTETPTKKSEYFLENAFAPCISYVITFLLKLNLTVFEHIYDLAVNSDPHLDLFWMKVTN